ncbi:hypothetical protein EJA01_07935 [Rhodovulum iodosum]|nr:hypothetical protein EJA01_07935 [Rhodovulum robiginosum]
MWRSAMSETARKRDACNALSARFAAVAEGQLARWQDRLAALERMRQTLGYTETLRRGYAVVRAGDEVVTTRAEAERAGPLEIEFQDGRFSPGGGAPKKRPSPKKPPEQGSLF